MGRSPWPAPLALASGSRSLPLRSTCGGCGRYQGMAGFQFIHVEGYASVSKIARSRSGQPVAARRRWSAAEVLDEASRAPKACSHIAQPAAPQWLLGSREAVEVAGADWLANTKVGKRKARSDAPWLLAGVVSLPRSEEAELWGDFALQAVTWLERRYGQRLRAVVQHLDEAHPHLHFYAVPRPGENFGVVHDGYAAKTAARQAGEQHTGKAYVAAMQALQDDFQNGFAWSFGLARRGPGRARLTREQWREVQARAEADAAERQAVDIRQAAKAKLTEALGVSAQLRAAAAQHVQQAHAEAAQRVEAEVSRVRSNAAKYWHRMRGDLRTERATLRAEQRQLAQQKDLLNVREIEIQALAAALTPDERREAANRLQGELQRRQATPASPRPAAPAVAPSRPPQQPPQRSMKPKAR